MERDGMPPALVDWLLLSAVIASRIYFDCRLYVLTDIDGPLPESRRRRALAVAVASGPAGLPPAARPRAGDGGSAAAPSVGYRRACTRSLGYVEVVCKT